MTELDEHASTHESKETGYLKNVLAQLPPFMERRTEKRYTEFEILDSVSNKIWVLEQFEADKFSNRSSSGICNFNDNFQRGTILPDGDVLVASNLAWRMAILQFSGSWYVTELRGLHSAPHRSISPERWGAVLAGIGDELVRTNAIRRMACQGVSGTSFRDLLIFVHEGHRTYPQTLHKNSTISFTA